LNPGRQRGSLTISYPESKAEFIEYLQSKCFNERYARCMISYLDKNVSELHEPMDVVRIFSKLSVGQQHNLSRALRTFLNFAELKGVRALAILWLIADVSKGEYQPSRRKGKFFETSSRRKTALEREYKCFSCRFFCKSECKRHEVLINAKPCEDFEWNE
jgi:hypothetical protein